MAELAKRQPPTSLPRGFTSPLRQAEYVRTCLFRRLVPGAKALRAHEAVFQPVFA